MLRVEQGSIEEANRLAMPIAGVTGPASHVDRYLDALRADFNAAEGRAEDERRRSETTRE